EAENLLQQAVESWRELRKDRREGFQIVKLAFALDNLGVLRWMQGKTSEATALFQEGFQLLGDAQGIGEKSVRASLQTDYGGLLVMAGQVTKGEPLLRQSLQEYRKIFAQPRWEMGATLTMLGQAAAAGQNFDDAIQFLEEGEKVYRDTLGSSNSYVAYNLGQQAVVLSARKDLKAAEEKAREAIATWRAISPNGKLAPADTCRTLAQILMKQNRSREAESYYRQAIAGYDSQAKKNYSAIVSLKLSLSQALLAQKRAVEAERIAHEASIEAEQNLGPENPMTNTAAQNLATIRNQPH
ncbi:MAG TPA: tetratricopeptide repeat protein, partial [Chthoniobacterales bacterium]|nr:tetratricopeptide repeat protein [Chthoniobacterales bacterium]